MRFTKMHGIGNDYVYVDCITNPAPADPVQLAIEISDRNFGVGGDGLILIRPSDVADARMQMLNADGSEAEMCGNGIRCVAKYVYDHKLAAKESLAIETGNGVLQLELETANGLAEQVRVDMGQPILAPADIPTTWTGERVVDEELTVGDHTFHVTCVSMGNPHCVIFIDGNSGQGASDDLVLGLGPLIEKDPRFPNRVNVEFVEVISPTEVRQRTWERGSGETLACGTGACAVCVAGVLSGRTERKILNHLTGGDLQLEWADNDHVFMTGPATEVFSGDWPS